MSKLVEFDNSDPHDCNNCKLSIKDPDKKLSVGCDRGDVEMVACKYGNYQYWEQPFEGVERV
jgi:hypothetical protein